MELNEASVKRAKNMVWTAANRYDIAPMYLFYKRDSSPCLYRNTMVGLAYCHLQESLFFPFLKGMECGIDPNQYLPLVFFVLEKTIYDRALSERPGLEVLRIEHAMAFPGEHPKFKGKADDPADRLFRHRYALLTGTPDAALSPDEERLYHALEEASSLPDEEMIPRIKEILWNNFFYRFIPARKEEKAQFLGVGALLLLAGGILADELSVGGDDLTEEDLLIPTAMSKRLLSHLTGATTPEEDLEYVREHFGNNLFTPAQNEKIRRIYCQGIHRRSRLWYAGPKVSGEQLPDELDLQIRKNKAYFDADRAAYDKSIERITDRLKSSIEEQLEPDTIHTRSGRLESDRVYRYRYLHDLAIFRKDVIYPSPDFTVDLLLDASSSRLKEQETIATQAYIIAQSLTRLGIPVQVSCFRTLRRYTILQKLKGYDETDSMDGIFHYFASGSNRDGLALNALTPLIEENIKKEGLPIRNHLLLVLTDALPSDPQKLPRTESRPGQSDYSGKIAVEDTHDAIRSLYQKRIHTAAIFLGLTSCVPNLKQIYGDSYVRIQEISQLPEAVSTLLLREIGRLRDH